MLYFFLFLLRYFPFWAIPFSLLFFELGVYHYSRRDRIPTLVSFGIAGSMVVASILWVVFEGYWRLGPWFKRFYESFS